MSKDFPLSNVTAAEGQAAETLLIQLIRTAYPTLDLRPGATMREMLVRPDAALDARETQRYDYLQVVRSLQLMADNPDMATADDVNALLANLGLTFRAGTLAQGFAKVSVTNASVVIVDQTMQFTADDGTVFALDGYFTVSTAAPVGANDLQLYPSNDGQYYYFLAPVVSLLPGADKNIVTGTALNLSSGSIPNFVTAEAYGTFSGGTDPETIQMLIERLPAAISHRTLDSRVSIEAVLRDPAGGQFEELQALSVQGFGDATQLRDKHNAHGVATGGKVDVYPRMFFRPAFTTLHKAGTRVASNTYQIELGAEDAPGFYAVRMVADAESVFAPAFAFGSIQADGGYAFAETRGSTGVANTFHDVLPTDVETYGTIFQTASLIVTGVPDTAATHMFKVEVYTTPRLAEVQAYVDSSGLRNLKADYLVRCPLICMVGLRVTVHATNPAALDRTAITNALVDYINSQSFVGQLTESQIVSVLHKFPIERVNLTHDPVSGLQLHGVVRDASGVVHRLGPRTLDLLDIYDPTVLLTPATTVFAAEPSNVFVTIRPTA